MAVVTLDLPPRPAVRSHRMNVRLQPETWQRLQAAATAAGAAPSELARHVLEQALHQAEAA